MITIRSISSATLLEALPAFVALLQDAVNSGASIGFLMPLAEAVAEKYWRGIAVDVAAGSRILIAAYEADDALVGTAQLDLVMKPNAPHRAEVQKLLVHTNYRGRGIGKQLLRFIDATALEHGRTLLVLDTLRGDVAEGMYERYGYVRVGVVPRFVIDERGQWGDTVYFYRLLDPTAKSGKSN